MPIMQPTAPLSPPTAPQAATNPVSSYQGVTTNPATDAARALTSFVSGGSWVVTYYQQLLGADNAPAAYDPNRKAPFQQYRKIVGMELLVQTPLSFNQDEDSKEFSVTGGATVYGFLPANVYDLFIAQAEDGRLGLFQVTSSEKTTYLKRANYTINYQLLNYLSPEYGDDLEGKVQETVQFVKSLLTDGQSPLLSTDQYSLYQGFDRLWMDLVGAYYADFFSNQRQTFLVPDQPVETYDTFVAHAMRDLVATDASLTVPLVRFPNVDGYTVMRQPTLYRALLESNPIHLARGIRHAGAVYSTAFRTIPYLSGIYFTGIDRVVFPTDPQDTVDLRYGMPQNLPTAALTGNQPIKAERLSRLLDASAQAFFTLCNAACLKAPSMLPPIAPLASDGYYVLTEAFYRHAQGPFASVLERMVYTTIEGKPVDQTALSDLAKTVPQWPNLERFYYTPLILALIVIAKRSQPTS